MNHPGRRRFTQLILLAGVSAGLSLFGWSDNWLVVNGLLSLTGALSGFGVLLNAPGSRLNFLLVAAVVIVLGSASGLLVSFASLRSVSTDLWAMTLDYAHTTAADLALAQAYTNGFAAVLWRLGWRLQQSGRLDRLHENVGRCLRDGQTAIAVLVALVLTAQVYLFNLGVVVYGGKDLAAEGEPTHPLLALVAPLVPVVPFVLAHYARNACRAGRLTYLLGLVALLFVELGWFFLFGRRSIGFFFVLLLAGFFFDQSVNGRYLRRHLLPLLLIGYAALKTADTYHKVRVAYSFQGAQRMTMAEVVAGLGTVDEETYERVRNRNLAARSSYSSMALGQFVNLFRTTSHGSLGGRVLTSSLLLATPSNFVVDKGELLAKEALYEKAFSLGLTDISETLYLESFIDFGGWGLLVYPSFLFALFYGLSGLASRSRSGLFSVVVAGVSVSLALAMIEVDMITFLATVRTLLVSYLLTGFVGRVFRRPVQPEPLETELKTAEP